VQLASGRDPAANLERAEALVARAASTGADVIVLPERWDCIGRAEDYFDAAEPLQGGAAVEAMARWARTLGAALVGGSVSERREGHEKISNTSCVFDAEGTLVALYRKIHLFDVEVGGRVYRESDSDEPGTEAVVTELEGWPVGLSVCYDLRFPELYRLLAVEGAELVTVPANFTAVTGRDHWHVLLRARAIENQLYVAAAAQTGPDAYGRSLIVDPWGTVLAQAPDEETVVVAELDRARLREIRAKLPSLANRRLDAWTTSSSAGS
jgi:deaminated glutathione amidase